MHLSRTDTNRQVVIRTDLARSAPDDLREMLRFFAAISRTNKRACRDLVHMKMSPAHPMTDEQIVRALEVYEEEFGIGPTVPRGVVEHAKGQRPDHFHCNYSLIDPANGRAVRSHDNYLKDEIVSRRLELEFGEAITPGPRMAEVIDELSRRGLTREAEALHPYASRPAGARLGHGVRQQADRLGIDADEFGGQVLACWTRAAGDEEAFDQALSEFGMRCAAGNKVVVVVDDRTGFAAPLVRLLRQTAKSRNETIEICQADFQDIYDRLPSSEAARDAGLMKAAAAAEAAVDAEIERFAAEAIADDERELAVRLRQARERERKRRREQLRRSLKERRAEIAAFYRRRDRIRRARVSRAFIVARWASNPALRQLAFAAAAGVVALGGGGLGAAMIAGGLAVAMLPGYERARTLAACSAAERVRDNTERGKLLSKVYAELMRQTSAKLDFDAIAKQNRVLAGFVAQCAVRGLENLSADQLTALRTAELRLGADLAEKVRHAVLAGPQGGAERLLSWYASGTPAHAKALQAALRAQEAKRRGVGR